MLKEEAGSSKEGGYQPNIPLLATQICWLRDTSPTLDIINLFFFITRRKNFHHSVLRTAFVLVKDINFLCDVLSEKVCHVTLPPHSGAVSFKTLFHLFI